MTDHKALRARNAGPWQKLRDAVRHADDWPVAGTAVRRFLDAESWALTELKQRLDALESRPLRPLSDVYDNEPRPAEQLADLVERSRRIDPDAARRALYAQTLARLVPDQVAMLSLLADRGSAPLVHVAASWLPAGPVSMTVLSNASGLGRDAGVLLRQYVPHYMSELIALDLFAVGAEEPALEHQYELLMADTQLRAAITRVRDELRMYPRIQRYSVRLSHYGASLWADCQPGADPG